MSEAFEPKLVVLVVPAHCTVGRGTRTEALVIAQPQLRWESGACLADDCLVGQ